MLAARFKALQILIAWIYLSENTKSVGLSLIEGRKGSHGIARPLLLFHSFALFPIFSFHPFFSIIIGSFIYESLTVCKSRGVEHQ